MSEPPWGVDSEHGRLLDVLVCAPHNFHWLPTSAISRATLESGRSFDPDLARRQHAEMVAAYEEAGVRVHFLEPDPALAYQVFARDSSAMTPSGAVIAQLHQWWRRGEYAPAIRFYQERLIPIRGMVTAAALEGGDVMILEPGLAVIGAGEGRTQEPAARQLAGWLSDEGWEVRVEPIPERYVHLDVLLGVLAERLLAACTDVLAAGFVDWLRGRGYELIEVSAADAFTLGANAISLGGERVLSTAGAGALNEAMRARGLTVYDPDLSMFTLGGGGAHCLAQALRRERVASR
ncbi:MAG TPA: arginine deiminase family protein [Solirubrobacterales bacterium]|nr:arginine deiminase family protein [Solirubrobacterales bacterium]